MIRVGGYTVCGFNESGYAEERADYGGSFGDFHRIRGGLAGKTE